MPALAQKRTTSPSPSPFAPAGGPNTLVYGNYLDEVWNALETDGPEMYTNYYFLTGVNYSVMGVIDAYNTNALAEAYEYAPYGRHRVIDPGTDATYFTSDDTYDELHPGAINNAIRYTGQRFDAESNLMYYKNRYYDPAAGRFIGRDPLGWGAGANRYGYVGARPTMAVDPLGLMAPNFTPMLKNFYEWQFGKKNYPGNKVQPAELKAELENNLIYNRGNIWRWDWLDFAPLQLWSEQIFLKPVRWFNDRVKTELEYNFYPKIGLAASCGDNTYGVAERYRGFPGFTVMMVNDPTSWDHTAAIFVPDAFIDEHGNFRGNSISDDWLVFDNWMGYVETYGRWRKRWPSRNFKLDRTDFNPKVLGY